MKISPRTSLSKRRDGASWHHSKDLVIPENIRLIPQPPYSPELNPAEHIWEELRENDFYNHCYKSLDEVNQKLCDGLMALAADPQHIRVSDVFSPSENDRLERKLVLAYWDDLFFGSP